MADDKRSIRLVKRFIGLASGRGGSSQARLAPVVLGLSKPFLANVTLLPEVSL